MEIQAADFLWEEKFNERRSITDTHARKRAFLLYEVDEFFF